MDGTTPHRIVGHVIATSSIVATFVGLLPAMAAAASLLWYLISIWETKTVQEWLARRRHRRATRNVSSV